MYRKLDPFYCHDSSILNNARNWTLGFSNVAVVVDVVDDDDDDDEDDDDEDDDDDDDDDGDDDEGEDNDNDKNNKPVPLACPYRDFSTKG